MQHLSTAFLIIALVIAVNEGGATAQDDNKTDQVADESKNRAVTIVDGPKYVTQPSPTQTANQTQPEQRPPSKPPHPAPDKQKIHVYVEQPRPYHQMILGPPSRHLYPKPMKLRHPPNSAHKFPRVIPLGSQHRNYYHSKSPTRQPLAFAASSGRPVRVPLKPPKFSVPVETINGIRTDFVRPPKIVKNSTTTTTTSTTTTTTTQRPLRNKRIWPKKILERRTEIFQNTSSAVNTSNTDQIPSTNRTDSTDLEIASATHYRFKYVNMNRTAQTSTTTFEPLTITRGYRRVQRVPKHTTSTAATVTDANYTRFAPNDWVPIVPSHYSKKRRPTQTPISKRSDSYFTSPEDDKHTIYLQNIPEDDKRTMFLQNFPEDSKRTTYLQTVPERENKHTMYLQNIPEDNKRVTYLQTAPEDNKRLLYLQPNENARESKRTVYLQSYGLVPVTNSRSKQPVHKKKKMGLFRKRKPTQNLYVYSDYSASPVVHSPTQHLAGDTHPDASQHQHYVTRIKHHHHHHHHRYIKTVEKPVKVPYKVEVPKPYPVTVEKKVPVEVEKIKVVEKPMPYPVPVEKRIPYPVEVKVPHPVPIKVIEKEYIPRPYPIVHHVPIYKNVEVKVPHPVPVPVPVEKRVPYRVEVQVPVDRPYPVTVEKKVPYPVPVKVLVPQPYPVEKRVPYPVEVTVKEPVEVVKHVPIRVPYPQPYPVRVPTPVAVPVEKRVPYPVEVEKKVPVPYKVLVPQKVEVEKKVPVYIPRPYPVEKKVPVNVPYAVPIYTEMPIYVNKPFRYSNSNDYHNVVSGGITVSNSNEETSTSAYHTATVHGNTGFAGFQSRSDVKSSESTSSAESTESTTHSESIKQYETTTESERTTPVTTESS